MPPHILDSRLLTDLCRTDEMRAVFDDMHLLQTRLDVEIALAQAEAAPGVIPVPVAEPLENAVLPQPADIVKIVEAMM